MSEYILTVKKQAQFLKKATGKNYAAPAKTHHFATEINGQAMIAACDGFNLHAIANTINLPQGFWQPFDTGYEKPLHPIDTPAWVALTLRDSLTSATIEVNHSLIVENPHNPDQMLFALPSGENVLITAQSWKFGTSLSNNFKVYSAGINRYVVIKHFDKSGNVIGLAIFLPCAQPKPASQNTQEKSVKPKTRKPNTNKKYFTTAQDWTKERRV